jgi:tRNA pseudouridine55 synthase
MKPSPFHGFLVMDKPGGMTSRDVVNRALGWFPRRTKLGHTGTLDPLATGVLVLAVGAGTRLTEYVQDMDKTYRTSLVLGATSTTDDADGTLTAVSGSQPPDRPAVERLSAALVGAIEQVPPAFSAAKVSGQRAYDKARRGEEVDLRPRPVQVYAIDILDYAYPRLDLEVRCGKGTYIRSLARDLGQQLGCGAYVRTLRRTRIGPFAADEGIGLDSDTASARARLLPLAAGLAQLPRLVVDATAKDRLCHGQSAAVQACASGNVALFDTTGRLIGVGAVDREQGLVAPTKILEGGAARED